jgi:hypothetical protein
MNRLKTKLVGLFIVGSLLGIGNMPAVASQKNVTEMATPVEDDAAYCQCTSQCWLTPGKEGTFSNGHLVHCGCWH